MTQPQLSVREVSWGHDNGHAGRRISFDAAWRNRPEDVNNPNGPRSETGKAPAWATDHQLVVNMQELGTIFYEDPKDSIYFDGTPVKLVLLVGKSRPGDEVQKVNGVRYVVVRADPIGRQWRINGKTTRDRPHTGISHAEDDDDTEVAV